MEPGTDQGIKHTQLLLGHFFLFSFSFFLFSFKLFAIYYNTTLCSIWNFWNLIWAKQFACNLNILVTTLYVHQPTLHYRASPPGGVQSGGGGPGQDPRALPHSHRPQGTGPAHLLVRAGWGGLFLVKMMMTVVLY